MPPGRCGHRPLRNSIGKQSVGADAHIGPPHRISCKKLSLRSQCAHWLWQSVPLDLCAGVLRIPTTSVRTGLGMTRKFLRLLSLRGRKAPVAIRSPAPTHLFPHPLKKRGGHPATSYKFSDCGVLTPPADPPERYAARLQLLLHSPQNDGAFCGGPWHEFQSSAEVNSACGKVLLRKTLVVEQKQQGKFRLRSFYSSS